MEVTNQVWSVANECVQVLSKLDALIIEAEDKKHAKDLIEDSRGRFQVWAANIGARQLSGSRKSLDFRLRDAPLVRSSVISGLYRLKRCATKSTRWLSNVERRVLNKPPD